MIEPNNGPTLSPKDNRLLAPKGSQARYTGEVLLRTRPKTYHRVVQLLSENTPVIQIMRLCRVAQDTVIAVRNREAQTISERKNKLATMLCDVATLGTERMAEKIPKAGLRDAAITTGIATDKMLALTGQTPAIQIANVIMPSEAEREARDQIHARLDEITRQLRDANKSTVDSQSTASPQ